MCLVFFQPLLTSYEAHVLFEEASWTPGQYPMDFYSKGSGPWTNYYEVRTPLQCPLHLSGAHVRWRIRRAEAVFDNPCRIPSPLLQFLLAELRIGASPCAVACRCAQDPAVVAEREAQKAERRKQRAARRAARQRAHIEVQVETPE